MSLAATLRRCQKKEFRGTWTPGERSIGEFGWTNPILVDEGNVIIASHGRLEAAKACGLASVPTITLTGLSAPQKRALALADNKLALNAGWDDALLRLELGELGLEGFDLSMIGFSPDELAALFVDKTVGLTDPDEVPDAPEPVTVLGDVWVLGRHRLVCGDSTDADVVAAALDGVMPDPWAKGVRDMTSEAIPLDRIARAGWLSSRPERLTGAERHRAGLRVGTAITAGTANLF